MARFNRRIWGWMFFDWASQPYFTLLLTFTFGPFFVAALAADPVQGQEYWGWMLTISGLFIAITAPVLGAMADGSGSRRSWIIFFSLLCSVGSFTLWWAAPGSAIYWPLISVAIGLIGAEFAIIFVNAMLPELGPKKELGVISGSGWAFGFVGGILALVIVLLFFAENNDGVTLLGNSPAFGLNPETREGTRFVGPFTAIWFIVFMIPFFFWTGERSERRSSETLSGLVKTIRKLPQNRSLFAFLGASMFYRDGLNGIIAFGGIYAAGVLEWSIVQIGLFGILLHVSGAIFAWLGGFADRRWGPKPVIIIASVALILVCALVFATSRQMVVGIPVKANSIAPDILFMICGCIMGGAGATMQAASRTMMVRLADKDRMTEAFGLYAFSGKATAFLAPFLIAVGTGITDDQRLGATPLILLFAVGLLLLRWVQPKGK